MRLSLQARPPFDLALTACVLRRVPQNPIYEAALAEPGATYRTVARRFQVTRQEICQYMALVKRLPTAVLSAVEAERDPLRLRRFSLRHLLAIARLGADSAKHDAFATLLDRGERAFELSEAPRRDLRNDSDRVHS